MKVLTDTYLIKVKIKNLHQQEKELLIDIENLDYELNGTMTRKLRESISFDLYRAYTDLNDIREEIKNLKKLLTTDKISV